MVDDVQSMTATGGSAQDDAPMKYDRRSLSYASTFQDPWKARIISAIELLTGKLTILRLVRKFERAGAPTGHCVTFLITFPSLARGRNWSSCWSSGSKAARTATEPTLKDVIPLMQLPATAVPAAAVERQSL